MSTQKLVPTANMRNVNANANAGMNIIAASIMNLTANTAPNTAMNMNTSIHISTIMIMTRMTPNT